MLASKPFVLGLFTFDKCFLYHPPCECFPCHPPPLRYYLVHPHCKLHEYVSAHIPCLIECSKSFSAHHKILIFIDHKYPLYTINHMHRMRKIQSDSSEKIRANKKIMRHQCIKGRIRPCQRFQLGHDMMVVG